MTVMFIVTSMTNFKTDMAVAYLKVIFQHLPGTNEGYPELIIGLILMNG
jgi:hypothetical protein